MVQDSSKPTELELKVEEYENLPAHLLGVDGWMLRSIPKEKRAAFLNGYEKLIRVVFQADSPMSDAERQKRVRFIQSITEAVDFLKSGESEYELSVEQVPSKRNPVIRLNDQIQQHLGEIGKLEAQLKKANGEIQDLSNVRKYLSDMLVKTESFARLRDYSDWHVKNFRTYPLNSMGVISISGRKIDFQNNNSGKSLLFVTFDEHFKHDRRKEVFSEVIEEKYLAGEKERFVFRNGKMEDDKESVKIVGGLPVVGVREFVDFYFLNVDRNSKELEPKQFREYLKKLVYQGNTDSVGQKMYEKMVTPFLVPFFDLGMPVLLRRDSNGEKKKTSLELFYVEGVNPQVDYGRMK